MFTREHMNMVNTVNMMNTVNADNFLSVPNGAIWRN